MEIIGHRVVVSCFTSFTQHYKKIRWERNIITLVIFLKTYTFKWNYKNVFKRSWLARCRPHLRFALNTSKIDVNSDVFLPEVISVFFVTQFFRQRMLEDRYDFLFFNKIYLNAPGVGDPTAFGSTYFEMLSMRQAFF